MFVGSRSSGGLAGLGQAKRLREFRGVWLVLAWFGTLGSGKCTPLVLLYSYEED